MKQKYLLFIISLWFFVPAFAQKAQISGTVKDTDGDPIPGVNIEVKSQRIGGSTDENGIFSLVIPADILIELSFHHINYKKFDTLISLQPDDHQLLSIIMEEDIKTLDQIEILGDSESRIRNEVSVIKVDPLSSKVLPTPFGEFNKILSTLPGVVSNNELSSSYSVRGGNFDENLVYVNDILVYRPFLIRAGQQEGLSFVNPDLVEHVEFSSGGWQPMYGDKLSSNLMIRYKKPTSFAGSATAGLLGGAFHVEGSSPDNKVNYILGARHKSSQYLLNTLETQGQYLPKFSDIQSYINFDLGNSKKSTGSSELGLLFSYSRNRYLVEPENRETTFGNLLDEVLRLFVAFDGKESMEYDIYQAGIKYSHAFNNKFKSDWIISGMNTREREYLDLEGGYRLCDVNKDLSSDQFDQCISLRGIGTNYHYARNRLNANIINVENRMVYQLNPNHQLKFGVGYFYQDIDDDILEYTFLDSADYVSVDDRIAVKNSLTASQFTGYIQDKFTFNSIHMITAGVRFNYFDLNDQFLVSPRVQYSLKPDWEKDIIFRASMGLYQQPPFYRELRDFEGNLNLELKAQSSVHAIAGLDYNLEIWNRPFKLTSELYYKYLYNVVPYDVDNVRVRYLAKNNAKAYATGIDVRLSGEFVPGTQSWFSLGLLNTREDLEEDGQGYIRRPSDQHLNLGIFFEDHIPNDPTMRMNLHLLIGSGLPFGPPNDIRNRSVYQGEIYRRVDIGFSKLIGLNKFLNSNSSLWLGVEILNLLGAENVISYSWIKDFNNRQYGIPNSLSARFLNGKVIVNF